MFLQKQRTVIIGAALVVALVLLFALFFVPGADTPGVQLADPGSGEGTGDGLSLHPAIGVEITTENVQAVIATLTRTEAYAREIRQTHYWDGGQRSGTRTAEIFRTPEALRISWDTRENMVITAEHYHLWFGTGAVITRPVAGLGESLDQILDEFQGVPSYEAVLELDPTQIIRAGYAQLDIGGALRAVIYLTVETGTRGYIDTYYICLATGLLVEMTTFDGDVPVYRFETLHLSIEPPVASDFLLPDGTDPLD
ncbi:MAG: hypothetical protein FWD84_02740 [Oscillospiraceae bacterium]|nr:hypothetical protein [Oscillospiraceae bacterium]